MCLTSAKAAGDLIPVCTSMIFDGIGTVTTSLFGSPFGHCLYEVVAFWLGFLNMIVGQSWRLRSSIALLFCFVSFRFVSKRRFLF